MSYLEVKVLAELADNTVIIKLSNGQTAQLDASEIITLPQSQNVAEPLEALAIHMDEIALRMRHMAQSSGQATERPVRPSDTPMSRPDTSASTGTSPAVERRNVEAGPVGINPTPQAPASPAPEKVPEAQNVSSTGSANNTLDNRIDSAVTRLLGERDKNTVELPFKLNDPNSGNGSISAKDARELNALWDLRPNLRAEIVRKIAGTMRPNLLAIKPYLDNEGLRRAVVVHLTSNDDAATRTSIIPPSLTAFLDDRPLSETLHAPNWGPDTDRSAKSSQKRPPNWDANIKQLDNVIDEDAMLQQQQQNYEQLKTLGQTVFGQGVEEKDGRSDG